jgi:exosortase
MLPMGFGIVVDHPHSETNAFRWIAFGAITALVTLLFTDVLVDLATEWWTHDEASYGMLIPPFVVYFASLKREAIRLIPAEQDSTGLWPLLGACVVFLLGRLAGEFFLTRISFVLVLGGLVWTFWGAARLRALAFPLVLLTTMVPLPGIVYNTVAAPLQLLASRVAAEFAQLLGVSIYRDGNIIHLATTSLGVAEACSGLHSLSALVIGSLLLGFLEDASLAGRILIVLISVPLAIGVNVLRVTGTAILADFKPELAMGYYHSFSGWLVFVIGFGLLWLIAKPVIRWTRRLA